ncbi:MAG: type III secretion inner membrane ring lipoprotein SctJ [Pseudomonadota bacterium]
MKTPYLTAMRAAAAALAICIAGCGAEVELISNLAEREANEVVAALGEGGIQSHKVAGKDGVVNLTVSQSDVAKAIGLMQSEGLPRERRATMGDVFRKEGLISSPLEERARYLWALSQELSETISQVDGVIKARVHVVLPERSTGGEPALPSSASVFIKHRRGYELEDSLPQIRRLVAGSIPGLSPDKVNIVLVAAAPPKTAAALSVPASAPAVRASGETKGAAALAKSLNPQWIYGLAGLAALAMIGVAGFLLWRGRQSRGSDVDNLSAQAQ